MKKILLTRGKSALVDDQDYEYLNQWKWRALKSKHTWYAVRTVLFECVMMHRVILGIGRGFEPDHRNGDGLDNRRENLRISTHAENMLNRRMQKNNKSGYKGVSPYKGKYQVQICAHGKKHYIGTFLNPVEAARAYDEAAKKYHGKFARLNFPK